MDFRSIHCPYCGLELHVPPHVEQVVCMYCARPIDVKELLSPSPAEPDGGCHLQDALSLLNPTLFRFEQEQKHFNRTDYSASFSDYSDRFLPALQAMHGAAQEDCAAFANALVSRMVDTLEADHVRSSRSSAFFSYRMMLAVYLIPALHDSAVPEAAAVLESFLKLWNERYPKEPLKAVGYDQINDGWKKKGCYITSAATRTLDLPDDCAELQTLRDFRDSWLLRQPYGPMMVQEYYIFAPTIAETIDAQPNAAGIYAKLWQEDILPCVREACTGEKHSCFQRYASMMLRLEAQYLS